MEVFFTDVLRLTINYRLSDLHVEIHKPKQCRVSVRTVTSLIIGGYVYSYEMFMGVIPETKTLVVSTNELQNQSIARCQMLTSLESSSAESQ